ncbi:RNA 2',3'-cyclic phosphodiesterase [Pseudonocardia parietis]|uniref:RNA 2',3'-cyclic phosphodiesterase n=1 Tax=Pseudonocardia parietis TaxID=570936 RepID=A0ABS4VZD5_9PSEU|nr:RNA 2',3'-cyclic phosphodiesterase [Pseudonocardia parietis]MBP2369083.1 2'-5' RNA ligase [Pseudonocardia parietis]
MRLFVAVTPPPDAIDELRSATAALRTGSEQLRWSAPEQWHLTLAFLGEVDDRARQDVVERLGRAAARHGPCTLSLAGAGRFGQRVLWTRVHGDVDRLRRLAASVRAAARRSRIAVEDRPYRPHLTLARARGDADLRPAVAALSGFAGREWTADELHLVHSRLGAGPDGRAHHELLRSWSLGRS